MKKICQTCHQDFDGTEWMEQCYKCYKDFRGQARISSMKQRKGVIILSHPNCTKEEINDWIKKKYGSVNTPENWGAVEITGHNRKVWWNCQDEN